MVPSYNLLRWWLGLLGSDFHSWFCSKVRRDEERSFFIFDGPNEGVFVDSLKHYPQGQRVTFEMKIRPSQKSNVSELTICQMELQLAANHFDEKGKICWLFVATARGSITQVESAGFWRDFSGEYWVSGLYYPDRRIGHIYTVSNVLSLGPKKK